MWLSNGAYYRPSALHNGLEPNTFRMSQAEVFRPADGPLVLRSGGNLGNGLAAPTDSYRKEGSRPSTQSSGYRFGRLSQHSFFARHNPHPGRVRHMKGLLDVPICSVNDSGFFANPQYTTQFPPNNFNNNKIKSWQNLPVNSSNINSQLHPINTITGLQFFMGKPLNMRVFREKAMPTFGMVPVTEAWRDELRALTEAAGLSPPRPPGQLPPTACRQAVPKPTPSRDDPRPRTTQYSADTGRLIPPGSRAMSRRSTRASSRQNFSNQLEHITGDPDNESMVLQMLAQILQTDDVNAVQSWLVSAGDREKAMVLDMIRAVMVNEHDYQKQGVPADYTAPPPPRTSDMVAGQVIGGPAPGTPDADNILKNIDRLSLDNVPARPSSQMGEEGRFMRYAYTPKEGAKRQPTPMNGDIFDDTCAPVNTDMFRPQTGAGRSRGGPRPRSPGKQPATPGPVPTSAARLRYTCTPVPDQSIEAQKQSLQDTVCGQD